MCKISLQGGTLRELGVPFSKHLTNGRVIWLDATYIKEYTHITMHVHTYACKYVCMYARVCTYIYTYTHTYIHNTYIHIYIHT